MTALAHRLLPRCDLPLSTLGFGGAPLGNLFTALTTQQALDTVRTAWDIGLRLFDTAPLYGHGLSERRLGAALDSYPRDAYVLCSKVGRLLAPNCDNTHTDAGLYVDPPAFDAHYDYSYDGTWRSVEQSLHRLGKSRLDLVWIHDIDRWTHGEDQPQRLKQALDGAQRALVEMREQGLITGFGLGVNEWQVCADFLRAGDPDCFLLAGRYTLLEQEAAHSFLPSCLAREVGIVIGGPFNTGILATGDSDTAYYNYAPAPADIRQRVQQLEHHCREFAVPLPAAALQFPLAHPAIVSVIPGARSPEEVAQNRQWFDHLIPDEFWQQLRAANLIVERAPLPGETV
jgi:D-threo-aldose 1-dehydrogenase